MKIFFTLFLFITSASIFAQNNVRVVSPTPTEVKIGDILPVTIEYTAERPVKFLVQLNKMGWGLTPAFVQSDEKFPAGTNKTAVIELRVKDKDGKKIVDPRLEYSLSVRMFKYRTKEMTDANTIAAEYQKYMVDVLSESGRGRNRMARRVRKFN